jgi:hypothetical protein
MRVPPHNLPHIYVLLSNLTMRVPPQSPSCICTLIQYDYEGPPTISLRYMYSYPIGLWGSPHSFPQVYVLLSNLTIRVPPQSPSGMCTLIYSDYEGPPQSPTGILCTLIQSDWRSPTISLTYRYSYPIWQWGSPPQSPSGICTLIQSDYEGHPPQSPSGIGTLMQSDYEGHPPQSPSGICTLIQSD